MLELQAVTPGNPPLRDNPPKNLASAERHIFSERPFYQSHIQAPRPDFGCREAPQIITMVSDRA